MQLETLTEAELKSLIVDMEKKVERLEQEKRDLHAECDRLMSLLVSPTKAAVSARHTKGPWHRNVPPATKYITIWSGRNTHVARVVTDGRLTPEEVEANCDLIAAAPELLASLQELELLVRQIESQPARNAAQAARQIIAKATGGK